MTAIITACPSCDSCDIARHTRRGKSSDHRWRCSACGHRFDDPTEREAKANGRRAPSSGLAAKLAEIGESVDT